MKGAVMRIGKIPFLRRLVPLLIFAALLMVGGVFFSYSTEAHPPQPVPSLEGADIELQKAAWSSYLREVGPSRAYESFKKIYETSDYPVRHAMMHVLGDVLYDNLGLEGFYICDDAFGYGCYHQLYITALEREGDEILATLAELCLSKEGRGQSFCVHGIGHGALEANVNSEDGLRKAIAVCDSVRGLLKNSLPICLDGAFMQFQNPNGGSGEVRPVDPAAPSRVCDVVTPEEFRFHCYLSIARWWLAASGHDYELASSLCTDVPAFFQPPCYRGIGVEAFVWNGFDPDGVTDVERTLEICSTIRGNKGEEYCRVGAASVARLFEIESEAVEGLCSGLSGEELAECVK